MNYMTDREEGISSNAVSRFLIAHFFLEWNLSILQNYFTYRMEGTLVMSHNVFYAYFMIAP